MRYRDTISHLRSHLQKEQLGLMRTTALSTAGFSAAVIFLLAQTKGQPAFSAVALWASIISLVTWLFGAQYISAYLLHGERTYKHINILVSAAIAVIGYATLFVAIVATVLKISVYAGIFLAVLGVILVIAVIKHTRAVERLCNNDDA